MNARERQVVRAIVAATTNDSMRWEQDTESKFHTWNTGTSAYLDTASATLSVHGQGSGDRIEVALNRAELAGVIGAVDGRIERGRTDLLNAYTVSVRNHGMRRIRTAPPATTLETAQAAFITALTARTAGGQLKWTRTLWDHEAYSTRVGGVDVILDPTRGISARENRSYSMDQDRMTGPERAVSLLAAVRRQVQARVMSETVRRLGGEGAASPGIA